MIRHFYYRYFLEKSDRLDSLFADLKDYQIMNSVWSLGMMMLKH